MDGWVTVHQFAKQLGVDVSTVNNAIRMGHLGDGVAKVKNLSRIKPDLALATWKKYHQDNPKASEPLRKAMGALPSASNEQSLADTAETITDAKIMKMTRAEAERMKSAFAALKIRAEYRQMIGDLLSRKDVYAAMYAHGQFMRQVLERLPAMIVDAVLAAPDRRSAQIESEKLMESALQEVANWTDGNVRITKNEQ